MTCPGNFRMGMAKKLPKHTVTCYISKVLLLLLSSPSFLSSAHLHAPSRHVYPPTIHCQSSLLVWVTCQIPFPSILSCRCDCHLVLSPTPRPCVLRNSSQQSSQQTPVPHASASQPVSQLAKQQSLQPV
ncbi:hypothetical protein HD806DRAFT_373773 [Xylariaceae sp. AK1471]|nr:hypothetical protein HD806DRAFT_373773 [Xylariaceae sp. AK1471]